MPATPLGRLGEALEREQRHHFHHAAGFQGVAVFAQLEQEEQHYPCPSTPRLPLPSLNRATLVWRPRAALVQLLDGQVGLPQGFGRLLRCLAELRQGLADLLGAAGLGVHALVHGLKSRRERLHLMNNLGEVRADPAHLLDPAAYFLGELVHAHDAGGDGGLHFLHHSFDVVGGDRGLVGEAADFHRDHGKAQSVFASFLGFDGGVQGEQVGLIGDLSDGGDDGIDIGRLFAEDGQFAADGAGSLHDLAHGTLPCGR